jgi:hypothetical protein
MVKREELDAALAQAETAREYLEATLAEAKAALVNTVTDAPKIAANQAEVIAKIEKARARCRQLRASLAEPSRAQSITRSRERIDSITKQSGELSRRETTARAPSRQLSKHAVQGGYKEAIDGSLRWKTIHRFNDALAMPQRVREIFGLLALVLAYLQYYFLDVQLQIASLPSAIPWLFHNGLR